MNTCSGCRHWFQDPQQQQIGTCEILTESGKVIVSGDWFLDTYDDFGCTEFKTK